MTEQTRKEFEEAVRNRFHVAMVDFERSGEGYLNACNDYMWWAWQESRAVIEVEFPTVCASDDPFELKRDIICEIEAIGLKVKP